MKELFKIDKINIFNLDKLDLEIDYIYNNYEYILNKIEIMGIDTLSKVYRKKLINYLIERNQYIVIDKGIIYGLDKIYSLYFSKLQDRNHINMGEIIKEKNILRRQFLFKYDEIKILSNLKLEEKIPCSEYTYSHQMKIMDIDEMRLKEPILDLGSGREANLVKGLRRKGMEAYGLDRYPSEKKYIFYGSWFDFEFKKNYWGTIIAHMSFSNHFIRENNKLYGKHIDYAKKYMEILDSIKEGGSFIYTPNLEFIEDLLGHQYKVIRKRVSKNNLSGGGYYTSKIIKKEKI